MSNQITLYKINKNQNVQMKKIKLLIIKNTSKTKKLEKKEYIILVKIIILRIKTT